MTCDTGKLIATLRKEKGWTQTELAEKLNVSDKAVSKWENGGMPSIEFLPKLSELFGVSIDYLVTGKETNFSTEKASTHSQDKDNYDSKKDPLGIKNLSSDELALILEDQKDLYTEEELETIEKQYNQNKRKETASRMRKNPKYRGKAWAIAKYEKGVKLSRIVCPECGELNENPDDHCEFCGFDFNELDDDQIVFAYTHENDKNLADMSDLVYEKENAGSPPGCFMYFISFLIPLIGIIAGAVNFKKRFWKGLFFFSLVVQIISLIIMIPFYIAYNEIGLYDFSYYRYW